MLRFLLAATLCLPLLAADTPPDLLDSARKGRTKDVEALLAKGADIEMKDRDGRTPLMLAAQYGRTATVELLLAKGAKPQTRDSHGWNAYMLALLAPGGGVAGVVHGTRDKVLALLPQPRHYRIQVNATWSPAQTRFTSCFMRPPDMTAHVRDLRPDAMVIETLQRYAVASGRGIVSIVRADARGTAEQSNLAPAEDADATVDLTVVPGVSCVQGMDHLIMPVHTQLSVKGASIAERDFGDQLKIGMKQESATNPNQHGPIYQAWAKSQAGPIYWFIVETLLGRE